MISGVQRVAIRTWVIAALALDDNGVALAGPTPSLPIVSSSLVVWDGEDGPRPADGPRVVLSIVGGTERAPTETSESVETVAGTPPYDLVTRYRDLLDVVLSIRCYSRRNPASPSFSQDADLVLRRLWSRVHSESLTAPLQAAGIATTRRGAITSIPRLVRGIQWESAASFDLNVRSTILTAERPGWIENVTGTGTLDPLPAATVDADATP